MFGEKDLGEEKLEKAGPHPRRAATQRDLSRARDEWRLVDSWREAARQARDTRPSWGGEGWWPGSDNRERTVTGARANQEGWRRPGGGQGASACDRWTRGRHIDPSLYDLRLHHHRQPRFLHVSVIRDHRFSLCSTSRFDS